MSPNKYSQCSCSVVSSKADSCAALWSYLLKSCDVTPETPTASIIQCGHERADENEQLVHKASLESL